MALVNMKDEKGSYLKYQPTKEEVIELFKGLNKACMIKPSDMSDIVKINLDKWNLMDSYPEIIKQVKS